MNSRVTHTSQTGGEFERLRCLHLGENDMFAGENDTNLSEVYRPPSTGRRDHHPGFSLMFNDGLYIMLLRN